MSGKFFEKLPIGLRITMRLIWCGILALIILGMVAATFEQIADNNSYNKDSDVIYSACERRYNEGEWGDLYSYMNLYNTYGPYYSRFWEAVNGADDYYTVFEAMEVYLSSEDYDLIPREDALKLARSCYASLTEAAEAAETNPGRNILNSFIDRLDERYTKELLTGES